MTGRRERGKQRTREALLEAASLVFAERGYDGASVEEIARAADVAVGSIYSRFGNKHGLFVALMERYVADDVERAGDALGRDGLIGAVVTMNAELVVEADSRRRELLDAESWVHAMRHDELRTTLRDHDRRSRAEAARLTGQHRGDRVWPLSDDELATAVLALYRGLIRQRRLDRDSVPEDLFGRVLATLAVGLDAYAGSGEDPLSRSTSE